MRTILSLASLALLAPPLLAQCNEVKLVASNGDDLDRFGYGVAIDGDRLLIPAKHDEAPLPDQGSAYVFEWNGASWVEDAQLVASDAQAGDLFGWTTSLDGDRALLGAVFHDLTVVDQGAAYVFERAGGVWSETQILFASDAAVDDFFGRAVALDGDWALVGAPFSDGAGGSSGSAYVFQRVGGVWTEVQELTASDATAGDRFGWSLHLDGARAVIGAHFHDALGADVGAAYVFDRVGSTFSESAKLQPGDATGEFGWIVRVDGDRIAVGAPADGTLGSTSGALYTFTESGGTWSEESKLVPADGAANDKFGTALALQGERILACAHGDDDRGNNSGSVYLYTRPAGAWELGAKWTASDAQPGDRFGRYLGLDGDRALVSSIHEDQNGADAGAAYVYDLAASFASFCACPLGPCGNGDPLAGCATSTGAGVRLDACGSASVLADDLVLTASGVPAGQFGLLFMGDAPATVGLGDGVRCVGSGGLGLFRYAAQNAGAGGALVYGPGLVGTASASFPANGQLTVGSTWYFQAWFRDPPGPCGSGVNLSNAVAVTFGQ